MFLVLIDAHSKWIETFPTSNSTSFTVIQCLRSVFARFGIPSTVVTDNGTCFVSAEFQAFLKSNGIYHVTSAPYHPASNGLAERAVQIIKQGLKKETKGDIHTRLAKVLFSYRITPQNTTGISPAELLVGRRLRTRLDLLRPNLEERVERKQKEQKQRHSRIAKERKFEIGDLVYIRNYNQGGKWLQRKIVDNIGKSMFRVCVKDGIFRRCHADQIRHWIDITNDVSEEIERDADDSLLYPSIENPTDQPTVSSISFSPSPSRSYPTRSQAPPDRYTPSWTGK